jgi:hypothetical protein
MGKQVTFFMTHEDEKVFLAAIEELAPVRLVRQTFSAQAQRELKSFQPVGRLSGDAYLCLVNTTLEAHVKVNSYPEQSRHCIDLLESEVVQFHRCEPFKTWLKNGRLWFDEQTSHGKKSPAFLKWANSLLKWIRTQYEKDDRGYFVGPHALELSKAGQLQLGPSAEPELSLEERKRILGLQ